ncbi:hypothetical protein OUZ56_018257 [Daphnia magna]|uniref:Copia protein (Gag-int-pol protein) n=1 Tax=Daphnia magna TaxID=35525 RepID=A0ABQ9Z8G6_9CRUS|nr:hypothetical protein OUZ56_018257 [Daphnia magna]
MANANVTKDTDHIDQFNGTNFPSWKYGIWMYLEKKGYTRVVEGIETEPEKILDETGEVVNHDLILAWKQKDVNARLSIYSAISSE